MHHQRYEYSPIIKRAPLRWPNQARLAVWIISNIEYHEFDGPGVGISPQRSLPDIPNYAWRDYSLRVGVWRFMEMMDRLGLRATVALNAKVCEYCPELIEEGRRRNWEFMGHGLTNSQLLVGMEPAQEAELIATTVSTIAKASGQAPSGWLCPGLAETPNTPDLLAAGGISYVCDWCNDDQPYPMRVKSGRLISVPYTLELNDIGFFLGRGGSPEQFRDAICGQFDVLYDEGAHSGRVMAIALHPFITGIPYRHKRLEEALAYITRRRDVWLTTGGEIANWYYQNYYK